MKKINVISSVYKNSSVNFDGFIINFDTEGKGIVDIEEEKEEDLERVFEIYPNLYKGDTLPNIKFYEKKEENKVTISSEIEILKESNKKLAIENITIKKENAELKNQISSLLIKLSDAEKSNIETKNDDFIAEKTTKETTEENFIKEDLSKKTLSQLKELLNTEDFISFKEEWKSLSKKEDIIDFILKKIEEN